MSQPTIDDLRTPSKSGFAGVNRKGSWYSARRSVYGRVRSERAEAEADVPALEARAGAPARVYASGKGWITVAYEYGPGRATAEEAAQDMIDRGWATDSVIRFAARKREIAGTLAAPPAPGRPVSKVPAAPRMGASHSAPPRTKSNEILSRAAQRAREQEREHNERRTDCCLYFMREIKGMERVVKVGFSFEPLWRIKGLQTANYRHLEIYAWRIVGTRKQARDIEQQFLNDHETDRVGGEWMRPTEAVYAGIDALLEKLDKERQAA